jgi:hypothetical protein
LERGHRSVYAPRILPGGVDRAVCVLPGAGSSRRAVASHPARDGLRATLAAASKNGGLRPWDRASAFRPALRLGPAPVVALSTFRPSCATVYLRQQRRLTVHRAVMKRPGRHRAVSFFRTSLSVVGRTGFADNSEIASATSFSVANVPSEFSSCRRSTGPDQQLENLL